MSRTAITLKLKMCLFLDEASYWAEKLLTDINLPPLMPDADNNFGGLLGLDFRKRWNDENTLANAKFFFFVQILVNYNDLRKRVSTTGSFYYITIKTEDYLIKEKLYAIGKCRRVILNCESIFDRQVRTHTKYRRTIYVLNECNIQLRCSRTSLIAQSQNSTMRKFHIVNWKHISLLR